MESDHCRVQWRLFREKAKRATRNEVPRPTGNSGPRQGKKNKKLYKRSYRAFIPLPTSTRGGCGFLASGQWVALLLGSFCSSRTDGKCWPLPVGVLSHSLATDFFREWPLGKWEPAPSHDARFPWPSLQTKAEKRFRRPKDPLCPPQGVRQP